MEQITHNNHYVPQLYLKNWGDFQNKVWQYRLLVPHKNFDVWKLKPVVSTASQNDLYTYFRSGKETDQFEKWFNQEVEIPVQDVLFKVINNIKLNSGDIQTITRFLASQYVRTPARLNRQLRFYNNVLPDLFESNIRNTLSELEENLRSGKPILQKQYEEIYNLVPAQIKISEQENGKSLLNYNVLIGRGIWLFEIKHVVLNTSKVLLNHHWEVIRASKGMHWCTSDDPVICSNFYEDNTYDFKGGWKRKGSEIIFPLSPYHILYTQVGDYNDHPSLQQNPIFSYYVQKLIIDHAHRFVYSASPLQDIESCRGRLINAKLFNEEREIWKNWHQEQSVAEIQFL
ncbi:DUF4238 domain-containing protein [Clostridium merdae]|uniref:DUF4238 domain-containing protein n=1 Tax=Clostridium merdae TaxID=1958780 RepID=UPI000A26AC72|nr:DUF4238 domain-containing protein [Clostridium merdae]